MSAASGRWENETELLRQLALGCGLSEVRKWGKPCFVLGERNVVLIQGFKAYVALLFFKGALLPDPEGLLCRVGENTQAARQLRFGSGPEITALAPTIMAYIRQAAANEAAGLGVKRKAVADYEIPAEWANRLVEDEALSAAFEALTPGRQKAYILYFSAPKQSKTRLARIEKYVGHILSGRGMSDGRVS